jgi:bacillolysin
MRVAVQTGGFATGGSISLHAPPRIHSPPAEGASDPHMLHNTRLRVAAARPYASGSASSGVLQVMRLELRPDGTTGDPVADTALRTAAIIDGWLLTRFGRNGIDGNGGAVELVVHAPDRRNAYWDASARRVELGDGDGEHWGAFGASVSVMAHELYHGVIDAEVQLNYEQAEQAALHESLADVFAAGVTGSWRIGEDVFTPGISGDAIRDLAAPGIAHVKDVARQGNEPHALSAVASLAAVRAAQRLGMEAMQQVWYRALVHYLPDGAGFAAAAHATSAAAAALYGTGSLQHQAVIAAWGSVGVNQHGS